MSFKINLPNEMRTEINDRIRLSELTSDLVVGVIEDLLNHALSQLGVTEPEPLDDQSSEPLFAVVKATDHNVFATRVTEKIREGWTLTGSFVYTWKVKRQPNGNEERRHTREAHFTRPVNFNAVLVRSKPPVNIKFPK